jgi:hypothetical protein
VKSCCIETQKSKWFVRPPSVVVEEWSSLRSCMCDITWYRTQLQAVPTCMNSCSCGGVGLGHLKWIEVYFIQTEGKMVLIEWGDYQDSPHHDMLFFWWGGGFGRAFWRGFVFGGGGGGGSFFKNLFRQFWTTVHVLSIRQAPSYCKVYLASEWHSNIHVILFRTWYCPLSFLAKVKLYPWLS